MVRTLMAGAALALVGLPAAATAQEGEKRDCVVSAATNELKTGLGSAMTGAGDDASREALFKQLGALTDSCAAKHNIAEANRGDYFAYSLARISREWLIGDIGKAGLPTAPVDKALDFGIGGANPDLSQDMTDEQIGAIIQGYIDNGHKIEDIDETVWEKVGAYAAATSIYWNKRKALPF